VRFQSRGGVGFSRSWNRASRQQLLFSAPKYASKTLWTQGTKLGPLKGIPTIEDVLAQLQSMNAQRVTLKTFMLVAGETMLAMILLEMKPIPGRRYLKKQAMRFQTTLMV
jgi:hypothetical protein